LRNARAQYFASTGDSPGTEWPSVSANVVAVGGTSVSRNPATRAFMGEAAWNNGGGCPSLYVARPAYQNSIKSIIGGTTRGVPDAAAGHSSGLKGSTKGVCGLAWCSFKLLKT
jgi:hypothetical protein